MEQEHYWHGGPEQHHQSQRKRAVEMLRQEWVNHGFNIQTFFFHSWPARIYSAVLLKFSSKCSWKVVINIRWLLYCTTAQHTHTHIPMQFLQRWKGPKFHHRAGERLISSYWKHWRALFQNANKRQIKKKNEFVMPFCCVLNLFTAPSMFHAKSLYFLG